MAFRINVNQPEMAEVLLSPASDGIGLIDHKKSAWAGAASRIPSGQLNAGSEF
jgi:hypothetical protein